MHLKHRLSCRSLAVLLAILALPACQSSSPGLSGVREPLQNADISGVFVHSPTEVAFPPSIGAFTRRDFKRSSGEAVSVLATYAATFPAGEALATIHVYPASWFRSLSPTGVEAWKVAGLCQQELESEMRPILLEQPSIVWEKGAGSLKGEGRILNYFAGFPGRLVDPSGTKTPRNFSFNLTCSLRAGLDAWVVDILISAPDGVDMQGIFGVLKQGTMSRRSTQGPGNMV